MLHLRRKLPGGLTGRRRRPEAMTTAVVIAGGPAPPLGVRERIPLDSVVVAADSGLDHARFLGLVPDYLIGDLDSISAEGLQWARRTGVVVQAHPADKDATDLELAIEAAATLADELLIVEGGSGRLDQAFGNLMLLASDRFGGTRITALVGESVISVVRGMRELSGDVGDLVSLFAVAERAHGVSTQGLRWRLEGAVLVPGSTVGVSNEFVARRARVQVETGVVLAVQP